MVLFFAHIPFVVNHTFDATPAERLQQHPLFVTTNRSDCTCFLWRLHLVRPSHPDHSTTLLRSENLSGMCAQLCTVAANNNRVHPPRSLHLLLVRSTHIWCCSSRTSRLWWIAHSTPAERLQQFQMLWSQMNAVSNERGLTLAPWCKQAKIGAVDHSWQFKRSIENECLWHWTKLIAWIILKHFKFSDTYFHNTS